ncbi:MAG: hypothetical protein JW827_11640 [Spirochaetes bacterium]|nr:hypothetical protein [Spirochaetota bacterium]
MKQIVIIITVLILFSCSAFKSSNPRIKNSDKIGDTTIQDTFDFERDRENFQMEIYTRLDGLLSDDIRDIKLDENKVWLLCTNGIIVFNKDTGRIVNYAYSNKAPGFNSFLHDGEYVYLSAERGIYGFNKIDKKYHTIVYDVTIVPSLVEYGRIFLGADRRGNIYLFKEKNLFNVTNVGHPLDLVRGFDDDIYFADQNAVYKMTGDLKLEKILAHGPNHITDFLIKDEIFFVANHSLIQYLPGDRKAVNIVAFHEKIFITFLFYSEEKEGLYIGTTQGMGYYDMIEKEYIPLLTQHKVKEAFINCLKEEDNILWIGTKTSGFVKYTALPSKIVYK